MLLVEASPGDPGEGHRPAGDLRPPAAHRRRDRRAAAGHGRVLRGGLAAGAGQAVHLRRAARRHPRGPPERARDPHPRRLHPDRVREGQQRPRRREESRGAVRRVLRPRRQSTTPGSAPCSTPSTTSSPPAADWQPTHTPADKSSQDSRESPDASSSPRHRRVRLVPRAGDRRLHRRRLLRPRRTDRVGEVDHHRRHHVRPVRHRAPLGTVQRRLLRPRTDHQPVHRLPDLRRRPGSATRSSARSAASARRSSRRTPASNGSTTRPRAPPPATRRQKPTSWPARSATSPPRSPTCSGWSSTTSASASFSPRASSPGSSRRPRGSDRRSSSSCSAPATTSRSARSPGRAPRRPRREVQILVRPARRPRARHPRSRHRGSRDAATSSPTSTTAIARPGRARDRGACRAGRAPHPARNKPCMPRPSCPKSRRPPDSPTGTLR